MARKEGIIMKKYIVTLPGKPRLYNTTPLIGWETVGEILRDDGITRGALVRNATTGLYAQANCGTIRNLDQREVALALAATVTAVDLDGEEELTAAEAAALVGKTVQGLDYWRRRGYLSPIDDRRPAKFRKSDVLAANAREIRPGPKPKE